MESINLRRLNESSPRLDVPTDGTAARPARPDGERAGASAPAPDFSRARPDKEGVRRVVVERF
jgi:hypothetical protein